MRAKMGRFALRLRWRWSSKHVGKIKQCLRDLVLLLGIHLSVLYAGTKLKTRPRSASSDHMLKACLPYHRRGRRSVDDAAGVVIDSLCSQSSIVRG